MDGKKVAGVLPKGIVKGQDAYVWIGIGVNINISPLETSTCLKDQFSSVENLPIIPFIESLTAKLY